MTLPPLDLLADPCRTCGGRSGVVRFLTGPQCPEHTPAATAGRTVPTPDPTMTAEALHDRPTNGFQPMPYGDATTDPLGRTIPGNSKNGFIPSLPCPNCRTPRSINHKGDHA